jgi:hypothetical protein
MKYLKRFESIDDIEKLGWVNIKIDENLIIRMAKYVTALDTVLTNERDKYDLYKKLEILSNIDSYIQKSNIDIQTKISIITLLQYINEIKGQFHPSSAGFLLEGFLAALIHGNKVSGNKSTDITNRQAPQLPSESESTEDDDENKEKLSYKDLDAVEFETSSGSMNKIKYQIKLYKKESTIKIKMNNICDYYVICLKDGNIFDIHILTPGDPSLTYEQNVLNSPSFIGKYASKVKGTNEYIRRTKSLKKVITYIELNTRFLETERPTKRRTNNTGHQYGIKLVIDDDTINGLISKCAESVKDSIEKVYTHLTDLHYDVDSLVSGYNKERILISPAEAKAKTDETLRKISTEVNKLESDISRK